ncbi:MAG: excinuclease ABC subunit UvrC [Deltaproteobacteria bacterium]|nr:excinuclease ABC subunit UvrC [Deltaproteobacteria bacterium]
MTAADVKTAPPYPALFEALKQAPKATGVYLFKDRKGRVLYVGKATNLKHRLSSYLKQPQKHYPKTAWMLKKMARVDFLLTATEKEALILERNLIKEHRPRFNVTLRDDKNFLCLRLNLKEDFPALRLVRRFVRDGALYFGPYASAGHLRETLKVMKQAFGLRTCKERPFRRRSRPCLNGQLGRCLAPCAGQVSREDYGKAVAEAVQFLRGRGRQVLSRLKEEMAEAAAELDFERAATLRDRITAITSTLERQDMARNLARDQDVFGVAANNGQALVMVLMVRGGMVTGSREYFFAEAPADRELLGDFLNQYYSEGRPLPDEILLPCEVADRRLLKEVLSDQKGRAVKLMVGGGGRRPGVRGQGSGFRGQGSGGSGRLSVVSGQETPESQTVPIANNALKSERARLLALAAENARAALKRRGPGVSPAEALEDLRERLNLAETPHRLECLDISTLQGNQPVGALVAFADGMPDKSGYRRFRIKGVAGQDDYAMLREIVGRHYGKEGQKLPDLLVVDGGKGQLQSVRTALQEVGLGDLPVAALAKAMETGSGETVPDRLFLPGRKNPKFLPANSPGWLLLLRLRDEAHRFAVSYHRRRARKELVESVLNQVPGIGPLRRQRLFKHYEDLEALKKATVEELAAVPGFNRRVAASLKQWLIKAEPEA